MKPFFRPLPTLLFLLSFIPVTGLQAADWIYCDRTLDLSHFGIDPILGLYAMDASGANQTVVANGYMFCPFFNRDGSVMSFSSMYPGLPMLAIYTVNREGHLNLLTPPIGLCSRASFSPDGQYVVYQVVIPPGGGSEGDGDPPPDAPTPRPTNTPVPNGFLPRNRPMEAYPPITLPDHPWPFIPMVPNGAFIAIARVDGTDQPWPFHRSIPGQELMEIWQSPCWHPTDPQRIVAAVMGQPHTRLAEGRLFSFRPDGTNMKVLFDPPMDFWNGISESHFCPVFSPDGKSLAYVRQMKNLNTMANFYSIFVMRDDASDAPGQQITPWDLAPVNMMTNGMDRLTWSPDGQWLAFMVATKGKMVPEGYDIFKVKRDGSGLTRLTKTQRASNPYWYPGQNFEKFFKPRVDPGTTPTVRPADTPTPLPTSTPVIPNTPTPLPTPIVPTPTPSSPVPTSTKTPTPDVSGITVYEFNVDTLAGCGWREVPGGFGQAAAGTVSPIWLYKKPISSSLDDRGLDITVLPGQVAFVYGVQPIDTRGKPVLLRLYLRAKQAEASVVLGALKGDLGIGAVDGSIASLMPMSAQAMVEKECCMVLLYEPDQGQQITPLIQVASRAQTGAVTVLIDRLEVTLLDESHSYSGALFSK